MGYQEVYAGWQANPEAFWLEAAEAIDWDTAPQQALFDRGEHIYEWFADARVNTCWSAVDRHVEAGRGEQVASCDTTMCRLSREGSRRARGDNWDGS